MNAAPAADDPHAQPPPVVEQRDPAVTQAGLFDPPGTQWQRLSPRFVQLRHLMVVLVWGAWTLAAVLAIGFAWRWLPAIGVAIVGVCWIIYRYWRAGRSCAVWGYAERETDLYLREGLLFRRLTSVPYGRMQLVEVTSGPIERRFGLATVRLVTAAAHTNAEIPGLDADAAAVLRDRLAERGEHQSMGL